MSQQTLTLSRPAPEPPAPRTDGNARPRAVLATVLVAQLMVVLDLSIVNVALPHIQGSLGFSGSSLSWVLNAYSLALGGLLLLGARIGDLLGRRPTFIAGITLFTLASLSGGIATSAAWLVAARAAQGVGAALAAPAVLSLLTTTFREGRARTRALGWYTAVSTGGASIGLIAGGVLTQLASWRWVMFVNVPIGIAVAVAAALVVPQTPRRNGRFDLLGAASSTAGMAALVYGLVHAGSHGWTHPTTLVTLVAGVVLLTWFVVVERTAAEPITPLTLFRNRTRSGSYVARMLMFAGMMGMFYFLTQFVQDVLGYSPLLSGLAFLPTTVALFAGSQLSARRLVDAFGERRVMLIGVTVSALGMVWLSRLADTSGYLDLLGPLVMVGLGNGAAFVPLTSAGLHAVRPHEAGAASGLINVAQQVGAALGLAALVTVSTTAQAGRSGIGALSESAHAQHVFTTGVDAAFTAAAVLFAAALVLVAALLRRVEVPERVA